MSNTNLTKEVTTLSDSIKSIVPQEINDVDEELVDLMNTDCPVVCPICGSTEFEVDDDPGMVGSHDKLCLKYYCTDCTYTWSEQYDICLD